MVAGEKEAEGMAGKGKLGGHDPLNLKIDGVGGGPAASVAAKSTWPVQDTMHVLHVADNVRTGASAVHHTSLAASFVSHLGGLISVAAGTAISAYINHLVHGHHEKTLLNRYRPQIAAITGKDEESLTVDDLKSVARYNRSLKQELDRNKGKRNLSTVATLVGSTLAFGAVFLAVATFPPLTALGAAAAAAKLTSWTAVGFVAACTAVSFGTLHIFGKGAKKLGEKLLGYNTPSVEDHVHAIDGLYKKGEHITPEQVMGVYVASNTRLQESIKDTFGAPYDKLNATQQQRAEEMFGANLPLEKLAADINAGSMNPRELIFFIHGQSSGVHTKGPEREHMLAEKTDAALDKVQGQVREEPPHEVAVQRSQAEAAQEQGQGQTAQTQWRAMLDKQRLIEQTPAHTTRVM